MKEKLILLYDQPIPAGFPSLSDAQKIISVNWENEIAQKKPSYVPKAGDRLKIFGTKKNKFPHSNEYVEFVENNGLFLPNAYGLIIIEYLDRISNFIKSGTFIMGIDDKRNLPFAKHIGHAVPVLLKNEENSYSYLILPWGMTLESDEVFPAFEWINT